MVGLGVQMVKTDLFVEFGTACTTSETIAAQRKIAPNVDDGSPGWRIVHARTGFALPMRFLRKSDAEMAMHAISGLADWSLTLLEVLEAVDPQTIRKTMTEALAW